VSIIEARKPTPTDSTATREDAAGLDNIGEIHAGDSIYPVQLSRENLGYLTGTTEARCP